MRLKDIANIKTGIVFSRQQATHCDKVQKKYRQITLTSFSDGIRPKATSLDTFVAKQTISEKHLSQTGDILVRLRAPNNAIYIDEAARGLIISSLIAVIRIHDPRRMDQEFLAYYLNSKPVQQALARYVRGTAIAMVHAGDIADIAIVGLPPLPVQRKIVKLMALLQAERSLLKDLIQQKELFAQEVLTGLINRSRPTSQCTDRANQST